MPDPFENGNTWFMYSKLERDFLDTTSYVALQINHNNVWSEKYGELLTRTGDLIDSVFRLMINSKSLDGETSVSTLRTKIVKKRTENQNWFPKIGDFRSAFESVFQLSKIEVDADYGLSSYGKLNPFKDFDTKNPSWWEPYNKVKHELFQEMEKKATLVHSLNALAGLFLLNILHKESQRYLIRYTDTIFVEFLQRKQIEKALGTSFIGAPHNMSAFKFIARTPLFTHVFRTDSDPSKKAGSLLE